MKIIYRLNKSKKYKFQIIPTRKTPPTKERLEAICRLWDKGII